MTVMSASAHRLHRIRRRGLSKYRGGRRDQIRAAIRESWGI